LHTSSNDLQFIFILLDSKPHPKRLLQFSPEKTSKKVKQSSQ